MSDMNYTPLNPDEAMHAFMDGELDGSEEQHLFDELASSPDLRSEMKDALSIRAAVHRDLLAPPATGEGGLLAAVGLSAGAAAGAAAGAGVATAVSGGMRALIATGIFSLAAGFLIAWLLLPREGGMDKQSVAGYSTQQQAAQQQPQPPQILSVPTRVDTVFAVRYINRPVVVREVRPVVEQLVADVQQEPVQNTESETSIAATKSSVVSANVAPNTTQAASWDVLRPEYESPTPTQPPVTMRVRTLASGLDADEPTPTSVQEALLPNTALALLYPLSSRQSLGIELGTESFVQEFTGMEDDREVVISQTPMLFWMGATYQAVPVDFDFLPGLSMFVEATLGMAFQQGPLGRAALGFVYQPFGPLRFSVGVDGSALMYSYQGSPFTSTKWGMTYGLSFDLGALK